MNAAQTQAKLDEHFRSLQERPYVRALLERARVGIASLEDVTALLAVFHAEGAAVALVLLDGTGLRALNGGVSSRALEAAHAAMARVGAGA